MIDPVYASNAFFDRLVAVPGWEKMAPTLAINRVQRNSDPCHYAKFESAANEILGALVGVKRGSGACGSGEWQPPVDMGAPGLMITDFYGMRDSSITGYAYLHSGLDLAGVRVGTPVAAAGSGTVERVVTVHNSAEGINVRINHDDSPQTF